MGFEPTVVSRDRGVRLASTRPLRKNFLLPRDSWNKVNHICPTLFSRTLNSFSASMIEKILLFFYLDGGSVMLSNIGCNHNARTFHLCNLLPLASIANDLTSFVLICSYWLPIRGPVGTRLTPSATRREFTITIALSRQPNKLGRSGRTRTCKAVRRWFPKPEGFHLPAYTSTETCAAPMINDLWVLVAERSCALPRIFCVPSSRRRHPPSSVSPLRSGSETGRFYENRQHGTFIRRERRGKSLLLVSS